MNVREIGSWMTSRLLLACRALASPFGAVAQLPMNGSIDPDFATVDTLALGHLAKHAQPGVSIVIGVGDRIVQAKGYGWADRGQPLHRAGVPDPFGARCAG